MVAVKGDRFSDIRYGPGGPAQFRRQIFIAFQWMAAYGATSLFDVASVKDCSPPVCEARRARLNGSSRPE
jgi:hypothetical protein